MNVQLESFVGYRGSAIVPLPAGRLAYPWATGVAFTTVATGGSDFWVPGDGMHEISAMTVNRQGTVLVCAERRLKSALLVFSLADRTVLQRIPDVASLGVADMAFSRDGRHFAILSGAPSHAVTLFSVDFQNKFTVVHQQKAANVHQFSQISFSPRDPQLLCTSGGGHAVFWTFDQQAASLTPAEGRVQTTGVRLTSHAWLPSGDVVCGSQAGELFQFDTKSAVGKILFDASDDEGAIVAVRVTKHHVVAAHARGLVRFVAHDGRTVEKVARLATRALTTFSILPEWHTFVAGGSDGVVELLHVPGYENVTMSPDQFAVAVPKSSLVTAFGGAPVVGVAHVGDAHAVGVVWANSLFGVYDYSTNTLLSRVHLGSTPTAAVGGCGASKSVVVTGHEDGVARVVSLSTAGAPQVLFRAKVAKGPITFVVPNEAGDTAVLSDGATLCFLRLAPSPDVICTVQLGSGLEHVAWLGQLGLLLGFRSGEVQHINVPDSVSIDAETLSASLEYLAVNSWKLDFPVVRMIAPCVFDEAIHLFVLSMDKETKLYVIDRTLPSDRKDRDTKPCKPHFTVRDHEKQGTSIQMLREKWLATTAGDGRVVLRDVSAYLQRSATMPKDARKDAVVQFNRHVPLHGGVRALCLSPDQTRIVTAGGDSALIVWTAGKTQRFAPQPFVRSDDGDDVVAQKPDADEPLMYPEKLAERARTLDQMEHAKHRESIKDAIARLRTRLEAIRRENDAAADDEKVELKDFLVQRQQQAFMEECERAIEEMRERIRWENVNRDFVIDTIRRECWDVMQVKLTPLEALSNKELVVYNFHTVRDERADLALLEKLKFLRRLQECDRRIRNVRELEDIMESQPESADGANAATAAAPTQPETLFEAEEGQKLPSLEERARADVSEFLYRPILVFTRNRAIIQMRLLSGRVRAIRHDFNIDFNSLVERKKSDIQRIEERNNRCRQVLKELEQDQTLFAPRMSERENPHLILTVADSEVNADKATDPDEKARLAQEAADLQRWRERHGNDDSSDRALKAWMDGRLEKEVRLLEIKVDKPEFADEKSEKFVPLDERSEDQVRMLAEYEKKLAKRIEEVNARRKSLQSELANLQKDNRETAAAFDKALAALLARRLHAASKCHEVELQQVKLAQGMLLQVERQRIAVKMEAQRAQLEDRARVARHAYEVANKDLQTRQERLEQLLADERAKHKNIRSLPPFSDSEEFAELLFKLYMKRKPKKDKPGVASGAGGSLGGAAAADGAKKGASGAGKGAAKGAKSDADGAIDPFAFIEREEEARKRQQAAEDAVPLPRIDRPEAVPDSLWDAFQNFRQDRLDAERDARRMEEEIAARTAEVQRLQAAMQEAEEASSEAIRQASAFQLEALREQYDLDELHVFKQGQVEVEQAPVVTDYADAILIHKSRVARLNDLIRASGREKVDKLREINAKRKEIRLIEWEIEHLQFSMQSLEMEYRHLHTLRVTKQMQEFINGGGEDHNEQQRIKLLRKIEHVQQSMSAKIAERQAQMLRLRRLIKDKDNENQLLLGQVGDAKSLVDDRRAIHDLQSSELDLERTDRLMRDMRVTRKLEDVAKAQQEEMVALKKEIDRLRARTFPSFAVVSKRVVGNPDEL